MQFPALQCQCQRFDASCKLLSVFVCAWICICNCLCPRGLGTYSGYETFEQVRTTPARDGVIAHEVVWQDAMRAAPWMRQQLDVLLGDVLRNADRIEQPHAVILVRKHVVEWL